MKPGDEVNRIETILGKDLYDDKHTLTFRIPTENLVHGDKLHVSVELLERDVDAKAHEKKGESKVKENE